MRFMHAILFGMVAAVFYAASNIPEHVDASGKPFVFWIVFLGGVIIWYVVADRWPLVP